MHYSIGFDGGLGLNEALSHELATLLHAVQSSLNGQGMHAQAATDTTASATATAAVDPCPRGKICTDKPPHDPLTVFGAGVLVGLAVGIGVGKMLGGGSNSAAGKT